MFGSYAETANLTAKLTLEDHFSGALQRIEGNTKRSASIMRNALGTALGVGLERAATKGVELITGQITGGLDSLGKLEDATSSVSGAIAQVGKNWTITGAQVAAMAVEIEGAVQSAFDDKDITQATATLIRYGGITQAQLKPAMLIMTDLAAKTGDVGSAAEALAKAMADPTHASRLLRNAGVALSDQQQKQIKDWVDSGQKAKAQAYLLDLVSQKTKGAAAAMHGPFVDAQRELHDAVEEAQKALAIGFLPILTEVRQELTKFLSKQENLDKIKSFGQGLADGFREVVKFVKQIPWEEVGRVASGLLDFGKGIAGAFMSLPTEAKSLILGLTALNKLSGGGVIKVGVDLLQGAGGALFQQFLGKGSPANPMFVVPVGGGLGGGPGGAPVGGGGSILGALGIAGLLVSAAVPIGQGLRQGLGITFGSQSQEAHARALASMGRTTTPDERSGDVSAHREQILEATRQNLQQLPDKISAKQQKQFDALRANAEANRIAIVNATNGSKSAVVAGAHSDRNAIVTAIQNNRPIVNVNVKATTTTTRISYTTGTTINSQHPGGFAGKGVGSLT